MLLPSQALEQPVKREDFLSGRNTADELAKPRCEIARVIDPQEEQSLMVFAETGKDISLDLIDIQNWFLFAALRRLSGFERRSGGRLERSFCIRHFVSPISSKKFFRS
nr:hypothetical protein [Planctomicrobium piriforme]